MFKKLIIRFLLSYIRFLAKIALKKHSPKIIGIAGSVGKSSTKNSLEAILRDHFPTKSVGNSETGIPLGILGLSPSSYSISDWTQMLIKAPFGIDFLAGTKYLIAEMGIDDPNPPKNMAYLLTILNPDIAIVLNESATHSMQFDKTISKEQKANSTHEELLKLVTQKIADEDCRIITQSSCKIAIYNSDNKNITRSLEDYKKLGDQKLLTFGSDKKNNIYYLDYSVSLKGTKYSFEIHSEETKIISLDFPELLLPKEYQEVFASSILASINLGLKTDQIKKSLEKNFSLPFGRASIFNGINNSHIIDSSYNSSKSSVFAFLDMLKLLKNQTKKQIVFVMGDMRELGEEAKIEHEAVAKKLVGIVDFLYCIGPLTQKYVLPVYPLSPSNYYLKEVRWFLDSKYAGEYLEKNLPKDSIVLVKGSQNTIFLEETIKYILKNKSDFSKLPRQSDFWLKTKSK